jgi:hypothetical protein
MCSSFKILQYVVLTHSLPLFFQVLKYIQESITTVDNSSALVHECLTALKKMELGFTEGELIQIANHIPTRQVELHLVVEDCCERLSEEQINDVLEVINKIYAKALKTDDNT